jgi:hypothetical protein
MPKRRRPAWERVEGTRNAQQARGSLSILSGADAGRSSRSADIRPSTALDLQHLRSAPQPQ